MSDEKLEKVFQPGEFDPNEIYDVLEKIGNDDKWEEFLEWRSKYKMFNYSWRNG